MKSSSNLVKSSTWSAITSLLSAGWSPMCTSYPDELSKHAYLRISVTMNNANAYVFSTSFICTPRRLGRNVGFASIVETPVIMDDSTRTIGKFLD